MISAKKRDEIKIEFSLNALMNTLVYAEYLLFYSSYKNEIIIIKKRSIKYIYKTRWTRSPSRVVVVVTA